MSIGVVKWASIALILALVSPGHGSPYPEDDTIKSYAGYSLLRTSPVANHEQTEQLLRYDGQHGKPFKQARKLTCILQGKISTHIN